MGNVRAMHGVPKEFHYYQIDPTDLSGISVGRGLRKRLIGFLACGEGGLDVCDERPQKGAGHHSVDLKSTIKLRDYQEGVPEQIAENEEGIIKLGTGFGKTLISLRVAELLGQRTLIIVPTKDILFQFKEEIGKYFSGASIGIIGSGENSVGDFTLATIQTLQRRIEKKEFEYPNDYFGTIFVDEAHKSVAKKTRATIEWFNPRYLYALTATPDRSDEQGEAIKFIFGPIIVDKQLDQKKPTIEFVKFTGHIPLTFNYAEVIEEQINNTERNEIIATEVERLIREESRTPLILTKRIAHFEILEKILAEKGIQTVAVRSDLPDSARKDLLRSLRSGTHSARCVVGTTSLLSTGVDIPHLDTLIIAGDLKSRVLAKQSAGRILRLFKGKQDPKIIDIWDTKNPILHRQGLARRKFYYEEDWL